MGIKISFCHEKLSPKAWIVKNIKQTCLLRKEKKRQKKKKEGQQQKQQLKMGIELKLTLEEWLLKSPTMEKDGNCNGEHSGFQHHSGNGYPSVARKNAYFCDSGEYSTLSLEQLLMNGDDYTTLSADYSAISLEKLLKDEKVGVKEMGFESLTRSQSSKGKKRVSFRLPEVSDIIILYPSEVDFEGSTYQAPFLNSSQLSQDQDLKSLNSSPS